MWTGDLIWVMPAIAGGLFCVGAKFYVRERLVPRLNAPGSAPWVDALVFGLRVAWGAHLRGPALAPRRWVSRRWHSLFRAQLGGGWGAVVQPQRRILAVWMHMYRPCGLLVSLRQATWEGVFMDSGAWDTVLAKGLDRSYRGLILGAGGWLLSQALTERIVDYAGLERTRAARGAPAVQPPHALSFFKALLGGIVCSVSFLGILSLGF